MWPHLLVELGVEKRSIVGAELMVPPNVETGEESVVAVAGFFWSSFRRCSYNNKEASVSNMEANLYPTTQYDRTKIFSFKIL